MAKLRVRLEGIGSRAELAQALRHVADDLHSDNVQEIYEIHANTYGVGVYVCLTDTSLERTPFKSTEKDNSTFINP